MLTQEQYIELTHALQRRRPHLGASYWTDNLPDPAKFSCPTVTMTREQLERFRESYAELMVFAASVLEKSVKDICPFDLVGWWMGQTNRLIHEMNESFTCGNCRNFRPGRGDDGSDLCTFKIRTHGPSDHCWYWTGK